MNDSELEMIRTSFSEFRRLFDADRRSDAEVYKQNVREFYLWFFGFLFAGESTRLEVIREFDNRTDIKNTESGFCVESIFPLVLNQEKLKSIIGQSKSLAAAIYILYIDDIPLGRNSGNDLNKRITQNENILRDPIVVKYLIKISLLDPQYGKYANLIDSTNFEIKNLIRGFEDKLSEGNASLDSIVEKMESKLNEITLTRVEFFESARLEIDAVKSSVIEIRNLDHALSTWRRKLVSHYIAGIGGWIILSGAIAFSVYELYVNIGFVRENIIDPIKTANNYALISIYLVPVVAIGWLLRILGRVVNTAFILADDASLRKALLETYYRLVADQEAKMQQGDRILILNALFRPLPGHQHEDISPPTLADLVGDALKGKKD